MSGNRGGSLYWLAEIKHREFPRPDHKILLWAIVDYVDAEDVCFPSQALIAKIMQVSERKVRGLLADMESLGFIERTPRFNEKMRRKSDQLRIIRSAIHALPEIDLPADPAGGSRSPHQSTDRQTVAGGTGPSHRQKRDRATGKNGTEPPAKTVRATGTLLPENRPVVEPPSRNHPVGTSAPPSVTGDTDDAAETLAHQLTVFAFEQPLKPDLASNGNHFAALRCIFLRILNQGHDPVRLRRAIEGGFVSVWSIGGVQTALANLDRGRNGQDTERGRIMDEIRQEVLWSNQR